MFDVKSKIKHKKDGLRIKDNLFKGEIELKNVYFKYPTPPYGNALKDITIKIKPG